MAQLVKKTEITISNAELFGGVYSASIRPRCGTGWSKIGFSTKGVLVYGELINGISGRAIFDSIRKLTKRRLQEGAKRGLKKAVDKKSNPCVMVPTRVRPEYYLGDGKYQGLVNTPWA